MEKLPSLQQCPGMMLLLITSYQKCSSGARWYNNTGRTAGRARTETRGAGWTVFPTAVQACCVTLPGHDGRLHVRHSCVHIWSAGAVEICSARSRVECNNKISEMSRSPTTEAGGKAKQILLNKPTFEQTIFILRCQSGWRCIYQPCRM